MIINTHAEIVFNNLGLPFNHTAIFRAASPYIIKLKKSSDIHVIIKIKNCEITFPSKLINVINIVKKEIQMNYFIWGKI